MSPYSLHLKKSNPAGIDILSLEIPDDSITEIEIDQLPRNWTDYPAPTILSEIAENDDFGHFLTNFCLFFTKKIYRSSDQERGGTSGCV